MCFNGFLSERKTMKTCDCEKWKRNVPEINSVIMLAYIHCTAEFKFDEFRYCPWCGKELKDDNV